MRVHPLWLVGGVVIALVIGVSWNESRRGYEAAHAESAPIAEAVPPPAPAAAQVEPEPAPPRPAQVEDPKLTAARSKIVALLKDPDSAQFRNEVVKQGGEVICMEVNARNAYGGYVGFSHALVMQRPGSEATVLIDSGREQIAKAVCDAS